MWRRKARWPELYWLRLDLTCGPSSTLNRRSPMTASEQRKFRTFPKTSIGADARWNIQSLATQACRAHNSRVFGSFWERSRGTQIASLNVFFHLSRPRNLSKKAGPTPCSALYHLQWLTEMRRLTSKPRAIESLTGSTLNDRSNKQVNVIADHSRKREANKREEYNLKPIRHIWKRHKC
jgi:hypothetical protein